MIGFGDVTRITADVGNVFREEYPELSPISPEIYIYLEFLQYDKKYKNAVIYFLFYFVRIFIINLFI